MTGVKATKIPAPVAPVATAQGPAELPSPEDVAARR